MSKLITNEHIATLIETSVLNTNDTAVIYWQSEVAIFLFCNIVHFRGYQIIFSIMN